MKFRLMRSLLTGVFLATALASAQPPPSRARAQPRGPQGDSQLDASETLFTVLAALDAAGFEGDVDSNANSPVRKQVRDLITARHPDSLEALKRSFADFHLPDPGANLSQYISLALTMDAPPDFHSRFRPEELPPDVRRLEGLDVRIARFYQEAGIGSLWQQFRPEYEQMIFDYHAGVTQALLETNAYLRNPTSGSRGRRFQIYLDLLGPPNQVQTRSYRDDYFVVVTPSVEPQIDQVRHAYLHYLLDPLALRYYDTLSRLKPLGEFANPAPALDNSFKDDFLLLATECVIKAVESRLAHSAQERQTLATRALSEGFVLTPALAEGLALYEKQEQAMSQYYLDLVGQIDLAHEDQRLEKVHFAEQAPVKLAKPAPPPSAPVLTGVEKLLADAEELYAKRDLDQARERYLKVLDQTDDKPMHAKAYYGLARIAALQKDPELSEKLFLKTLELSPDNETKSWAYLYLGRLADAAGERNEAEKNYRAALAVEGAPASVKAAAEKGLAQPFQR
jgi:tetratricopeptide (TPR) repeat protein